MALRRVASVSGAEVKNVWSNSHWNSASLTGSRSGAVSRAVLAWAPFSPAAEPAGDGAAVWKGGVLKVSGASPADDFTPSTPSLALDEFGVIPSTAGLAAGKTALWMASIIW